jgi:hypothetical protein
MFLKRSFGLDIECLTTLFTNTGHKHRSRTMFNQFCSLTLFALVCTRLKKSRNNGDEQNAVVLWVVSSPSDEWSPTQPPFYPLRELTDCTSYAFSYSREKSVFLINLLSAQSPLLTSISPFQTISTAKKTVSSGVRYLWYTLIYTNG